jgi:transcription initiation factor TFIID subunit 13
MKRKDAPEDEEELTESPAPKKKKKNQNSSSEDSDSDNDKKSKKKKTNKKSEKKRVFTKEIKSMMFGFGEVSNPIPETVELIEDLVMQYVHGMTIKAFQSSQRRGKLTTDDFLHAVRNDEKKYARAQELLKSEEEIKEARKAFEEKEKKM